MPKDNRIFITLAVDMDRHPKFATLNDAQKWLIVRAIMHSREYLTDGRISLPAWRKMGTNRNRKAVLATGVCSESAEQNCVIFHDYAQHNQTRAEVDAAKEKARSAGQKGGQAKAANARRNSPPHLSDGLAPARDSASGYVPEIEMEREVTTYFSSGPNVSSARERDPMHQPGKQIDIDGWKIVRPLCGNLPQATKTALATHAAAMLHQGIPADDIRAGLEKWLTKDLGPSQLPHLVSDIIRARQRPAPGTSTELAGNDREVTEILARGNRLASQARAEQANNTLPAPTILEITA